MYQNISKYKYQNISIKIYMYQNIYVSKYICIQKIYVSKCIESYESRCLLQITECDRIVSFHSPHKSVSV